MTLLLASLSPNLGIFPRLWEVGFPPSMGEKKTLLPSSLPLCFHYECNEIMCVKLGGSVPTPCLVLFYKVPLPGLENPNYSRLAISF